ncbi:MULTISPECIES: KOW motif-containing protein [unclassified Kitasatospora]|uniref:KOW motif-containing protein n=1 Tax=unclassified Kitasatospora TaxID=2633591 RepID=UPI0034026B35
MPHESDVQEGDDVRVTGGPFADFTGPVLAVDHARGRVQLTVDILGDVTRIDIPLSDVVRVA